MPFVVVPAVAVPHLQLEFPNEVIGVSQLGSIPRLQICGEERLPMSIVRSTSAKRVSAPVVPPPSENPKSKRLSEDSRTTKSEYVRVNWPTVVDGLIRAAAQGNVRAFLVLRQEAWGDPISGAVKPVTTISLEEILSENEGVLNLQSKLASAKKERP